MLISEAIQQLLKLHAEHGDLPLHILRNGAGGTQEVTVLQADLVRDPFGASFQPLATASEEGAFKVALVHTPGNFPCGCC